MTLEFFTTSDGARIAYQDEGTGIPVVALAGLPRGLTDYDYVAPYLHDARLIAVDNRGRGQSTFSGAPTYTLAREGRDVIELLDHLAIPRAAILGTSWGGMIAMHLAQVAHSRLAGIALNDVGPVLNHAGLMKIFGFIGRNPAAKSLPDLIAKLPRMMEGFHNVPDTRWQQEIERHFELSDGRPVNNYDPAVREAFITMFGDMRLPENHNPSDWPAFDACEGLPMCLIRGENSDLLTHETVAEMRARRPDMLFAEVPDRAHVPFLDEPPAVAVLRDWLGRIVI